MSLYVEQVLTIVLGEPSPMPTLVSLTYPILYKIWL